MAFNSNDIYVAGGKDKIYNLWTPGVRKFDSNSFYNWKQDNVPLYDLEDRTYHLWEKLGWDTSSVEGVVLTVSADASAFIVDATTGESIYDLDPNIFVDVSSAIAAVPEVVRYPIRIEICNFGTLGSLELKNLKFTKNGSLEIVNRNFAKLDSLSSFVVASADAGPNPTRGYPQNIYVSGVSSIDLGTMISASAGYGISALEISSLLSSGTQANGGDSRFLNNSWIFMQNPPESQEGSNVRRASTMTAGLFTEHPNTNLNLFKLNPYDRDDDLGMKTYDQSAIPVSGTTPSTSGTGPVLHLNREGWNTAVDRGAEGFDSTHIGTGLFYGNYFDSISIQNCAGPLYIRNMLVNGTNPAKIGDTLTSYDRDIGIDISNSDMVLENCAAWRCNKAGIDISNSKVVLSRGCVAYRNFQYDQRATDTSGAGLKAFNSEITVSAGYEASASDLLMSFNRNTNGVILENSVLKGGYTRIATDNALAVGSVQAFENNHYGFKVRNSTIDLNGKIEGWENTHAFSLVNSYLTVDELAAEYNAIGMELNNSHVIYGKNLIRKGFDASLNRCYLQNSNENGTTQTATSFGTTVDDPGQINFAWNGVHLKMKNSTYKHPDKLLYDGTNFKIGRCKFKNSFERLPRGNPATIPTNWDQYLPNSPSIQLRNNSETQFFQTTIFTLGIPSENVWAFFSDFIEGNHNPEGIAPGNGTFSVARQGNPNAQSGAAVLVDDQSTAIFEGTKSAVTYLDGPSKYNRQKNMSLVTAKNRSTVKFHGPTLMLRAGIDVLAEDNSKMIFSPPRTEGGAIDSSSFNLYDGDNHTKVDLHSSRACVVANNNSEIMMEDLGDYNKHWDTTLNTPVLSGEPSSLILSANYDTFYTSAFTQNGHMQFYANPQLQSTAEVPYNPSAYTKGNADGNLPDNMSLPLESTTTAADTADSFGGTFALSMGGVCLRVLDNSKVTVKNVHFPCGWHNPSAIYYNFNPSADTEGCEQLHIWNIDDSSEFEGSYTSVSSTFPAAAPYNGPSATYMYTPGGLDPGFAAAGAALSGAASGAPSSTPNTGSSSILDSFGQYLVGYDDGTEPQNYHFVGPANFGPFRLYFAPLGAAKWLCYANRNYLGIGGQVGQPNTSSLDTGIIYQTLAQGYNPSACVSSTVTDDVGSVYASGPTWPTNIHGKLNPISLNGSGGMLPNGEDWYYFVAANGDVDARAPAFAYVKDFLPRDYYGRVRLDESAIATFANAKNGTLGTSGRIRLVTMTRSLTTAAGQGGQGTSEVPSHKQAGTGFLSAETFDLRSQD